VPLWDNHCAIAGTFGKVMLARKKDDKQVFAIKILKKSMVLEKDELVHTLTENNVLAKCQHPFLTRLYVVVPSPPPPRRRRRRLTSLSLSLSLYLSLSLSLSFPTHLI
jgi:serine/threonine protein kinase